jgi:deazaflavin-dependent oxidoreductase (nitroreductase family)
MAGIGKDSFCGHPSTDVVARATFWLYYRIECRDPATRAIQEHTMTSWNQALIDDMRAHEGHPSTGPFVGRDVLILTTTGAKTGESRETPLVYSRSGDDIVIVASMGGAPRHPSWYHNLVANPRVTVELDGNRFGAVARVVGHDERRRLYDRHAQANPSFLDYEAKTSRVIPVILLSRSAAAAA